MIGAGDMPEVGITTAEAVITARAVAASASDLATPRAMAITSAWDTAIARVDITGIAIDRFTGPFIDRSTIRLRRSITPRRQFITRRRPITARRPRIIRWAAITTGDPGISAP